MRGIRTKKELRASFAHAGYGVIAEWLTRVAAELENQCLLSEPLSARRIAMLCNNNGIAIPHLQKEEEPYLRIGCLMKEAMPFNRPWHIRIGAYLIERIILKLPAKGGKGNEKREMKCYLFSKAATPESKPTWNRGAMMPQVCNEDEFSDDDDDMLFQELPWMPHMGIPVADATSQEN